MEKRIMEYTKPEVIVFGMENTRPLCESGNSTIEDREDNPYVWDED